MKIKDVDQLKEIIEYEKQRWLVHNGMNPDDKVSRVREVNYVESLRYVEYYHNFPKWKRFMRGYYLYFIA